MEKILIKPRPISMTLLLLLLLLLLLSVPCFSTVVSVEVKDKEVYEIDYRGPETHSSIPPPDHFHGHRHWVHPQTVVSPLKHSSKGLRGGGFNGRNGNNNHG